MPAGTTAGASPTLSELQREVAELSQRLRAQREEYNEALQREAAVGEILRIVNAASGDLTPVFQAILEKAMELCGASFGGLWTFDAGRYNVAALHGVPRAYAEFLHQTTFLPGPGSAPDRFLHGERSALQNVDLADEELYRAGDTQRRALVDLGGARTALHAPLCKDDGVIGYLTIYRQKVQPFDDRQIGLLQTFAAHAVLAMVNARLLAETRQGLEQQTATAEVLQVINSSPGRLEPVFDAMLQKAVRLCSADAGALTTFNGRHFHVVALLGFPGMGEFPRGPLDPHPETGIGRVAAGEKTVHILDCAAGEAFRSGDHGRRAIVELGGARTQLCVALRKEDKVLGAFTIWRREVRAFEDTQIRLLENFATQATIAMDNARLITETREALERQTATTEVLEVINASPGNLQPVFDAMLERAVRLSEFAFGMMNFYENNRFRRVALLGVPKSLIEQEGALPAPGPRNTLSRLLNGEDVIHIEDLAASPSYREGDARSRAMVELGGARSLLTVALRKDSKLLGNLTAYRQEVRPFSEKQIGLLQNFAAQAVIAMENARLLDELRRRQADLARTVDELTATGDVLKAISRSSTDLKAVLHTLLETVARLCRADQTYMFRRHDDLHHLVASYGLLPEAEEFIRTHPFVPGDGTTSGRAVLERRIVQIEDVLSDPRYSYREGQKAAAFRTMLGIPLLREETLVGVFVLSRTHVERFTQKEIDLAGSFADQAVIAIENARLFEELRDRQAELRVTFDNMGDGVAMFDDDHRLAAWNRNFQQIMRLSEEWLARRPTYVEYLGLLAERGEFGTENVEAELASRLEHTERELRLERTRADGTVIEVRRNGVPGGGFVLIYGDITERRRAEEAIRQARDVAETALNELKTAQASLIHAEKMASLGQLTAGIAHEIKNPLNFVNNFAGLSMELLEELNEAAAPVRKSLDEKSRAELDETIALLNTNLDKIRTHGRRADGIVKSMLLHSRGGSGDRQTVDINAVLEEALNLAYHGARAQDQGFNVTLERDLQTNLAPIEIVPQDVTRVFLNLIGNGFYAIAKRRRAEGEAFRPIMKVTTREVPHAVEIVIRDNGVGIPVEHRERLFQPFFTTKPTGEGTGLGLSISYDIVTQQHGGAITVDSEPRQFTEFTITLPRRRPASIAAESRHERQHPGGR